ncbi:helix-turn-helix transcriptional regulator [Paracoccus versutus]|uniref:helix-turn-helix domain-containing protein n=1 Tax=Paracoccus versutus TaxID=34007 RepID=UPI001FB701DE|nr:helix-turn-helix transcriptional regulator [Paracoccus versutus]MCJ1900966.1 helix-turn-helix transcriptional regulator [Paracoccus versutus]
MKPHNGPSGAELQARRKAKGWTQRRLAEAAGVGRTAIQYWEAKPHLDPRGWAVQRMAEALGWVIWPISIRDTCARDGLLSPAKRMAALAEAQLAAFKAREAARAGKRRVICGAKTRKGTPCKAKSIPGKRRCKFHGGMSTGARTPEGRERCREAVIRRWAKARGESIPGPQDNQAHNPVLTHDLEEPANART